MTRRSRGTRGSAQTVERYIACGSGRRMFMKTRPTVQRSLVLDAGLDKLQAFLLTMVPGDEVSVPRAMEISGLDEAQCDAVLDALARAGLMMRLQHDAYVRRRLD